MGEAAAVPADLGRLPGIGQIGIVVRDMDRAMAVQSVLIGVPRWYRTRTEERTTLYRGRPVPLELDIVVGYSGRLQVELVEVLSPGPDDVYHEVLGADGAGFHHLGVIVRNLDDHLARLEGTGVEVLQASTIRNAGGMVIRTAHLETRPSCGFITELIEARVRGLSVGMPRWLTRLGARLGRAELLEPR
jgi:hypothetical protein